MGLLQQGGVLGADEPAVLLLLKAGDLGPGLLQLLARLGAQPLGHRRQGDAGAAGPQVGGLIGERQGLTTCLRRHVDRLRNLNSRLCSLDRCI